MAVDIASWGKPTPQDTWWQLLVQHFQRFAKLSCHPYQSYQLIKCLRTFNPIGFVSGVVCNRRTDLIPSFKYAQTSLSQLSLRKQLHIGFVVFKEPSEHLRGHWLWTGQQAVNARCLDRNKLIIFEKCRRDVKNFMSKFLTLWHSPLFSDARVSKFMCLYPLPIFAISSIVKSCEDHEETKITLK